MAARNNYSDGFRRAGHVDSGEVGVYESAIYYRVHYVVSLICRCSRTHSNAKSSRDYVCMGEQIITNRIHVFNMVVGYDKYYCLGLWGYHFGGSVSCPLSQSQNGQR